jgi:hypothetical protein
VPPTNYEADLDATGAHPPASTSSMSAVAGTSDEASTSSANVAPSITGTSNDIIMSVASPAPTRPFPTAHAFLACYSLLPDSLYNVQRCKVFM